MATQTGEEVAAGLVARQMAAKWKKRVVPDANSTASLKDAFGTRARPMDPAMSLAAKYKKKQLMPSLTDQAAAEARKEFSKKAVVWLDILSGVLHGCDYLVSRLRELFKDPMRVSLVPSSEWKALTKLLKTKGLPGEADKLGNLVIDLRRSAPMPISQQAADQQADDGRGEISAAIEDDALQQMQHAADSMDARIATLTLNSARCLAGGDRAGYLESSEQSTVLQEVSEMIRLAIRRVRWRAAIACGRKPVGENPEKDAEAELENVLNAGIHELARVTRKSHAIATVLGSFGVEEAIELKAATELLRQTGAFECYVHDDLQVESQMARVQAPVAPPKAKKKRAEIDWANRFHTENSAIRGLLRRRHSISEDPSAARALAALLEAEERKNLPLQAPKKTKTITTKLDSTFPATKKERRRSSVAGLSVNASDELLKSSTDELDLASPTDSIMSSPARMLSSQQLPPNLQPAGSSLEFEDHQPQVEPGTMTSPLSPAPAASQNLASPELEPETMASPLSPTPAASQSLASPQLEPATMASPLSPAPPLSASVSISPISSPTAPVPIRGGAKAAQQPVAAAQVKPPDRQAGIKSRPDATALKQDQFTFGLPGQPLTQPPIAFRAKTLGGKAPRSRRRHSHAGDLKPVAALSKCSVGFGGGMQNAYSKLPDITPQPKPQKSGHTEYYEVLSISASFTSSELKKAYLTAATESHPDRNVGGDDYASASKFAAVAEAYRVLSNNSLRHLYDSGGPDAVRAYEAEAMQRAREEELEKLISGTGAICAHGRETSRCETCCKLHRKLAKAGK